MGYMHIDNLYKNQSVLMFRECYALEKIHGTSAHVRWADGQVSFFSGGEKYERFTALFDAASLAKKFAEIGFTEAVVYGEAYGGSQQKQAWRYGASLRFVAFDVLVNGKWLEVPVAADVVRRLGLEFVHYARVPTTLPALDAERDAPSAQALRNGLVGEFPREGVVLRPIVELLTKNGSRIIAKHKRDEERETKTPRKVVNPKELEVLTAADAVAEEWVTPMRLMHVLDKLGNPSIDAMPRVIAAMVEDVEREASGEIVSGKAARKAIGKRTAELFKQKLRDDLVSTAEAAE